MRMSCSVHTLRSVCFCHPARLDVTLEAYRMQSSHHFSICSYSTSILSKTFVVAQRLRPSEPKYTPTIFLHSRILLSEYQTTF